jgi:hypothetical protein
MMHKIPDASFCFALADAHHMISASLWESATAMAISPFTPHLYTNKYYLKRSKMGRKVVKPERSK